MERPRKSNKMSSNVRPRKGGDGHLAKFQPSWNELFPFIQPVEDRHFFYCAACQKTVKCYHQGRFDLVRHMRGNRHKLNMIAANISSEVTPEILRKAEFMNFPTKYLYEFLSDEVANRLPILERSRLEGRARTSPASAPGRIAPKSAAVVFPSDGFYQDVRKDLPCRKTQQDENDSYGSEPEDWQERGPEEVDQFDYVFAEEVHLSGSDGELDDPSQMINSPEMDVPNDDVPGASIKMDLVQQAVRSKYVVINENMECNELPVTTAHSTHQSIETEHSGEDQPTRTCIKLEQDDDSLIRPQDYEIMTNAPVPKSLSTKPDRHKNVRMQRNGMGDGPNTMQFKERRLYQAHSDGMQMSNHSNMREKEEMSRSNPYEMIKEHPRSLIPELLKQFYGLGWVTGTGGGISIKYGDEIFIAPSGVQKERVQPEDLFVTNLQEEDVSGPPPSKKLKKSQCTPLFMSCYTLRGAKACIHTHSKNAVYATMMSQGCEFSITHQEMIKGIKKATTGQNYRYDERLVVPIVENTPFEKDLKGSLEKAMHKYPDTHAVLVRRHGVYVWGDSWEKAKTMCECYDYLFEIAVGLKQLGIDYTKGPEGGIVG
ncbi:uncharacterized protein LOC121421047 [Lytechinus variegatus]|uniref:uncharacterized protein LOC121421047 n=1 Tax=Lytechinus variegatus TaxID=7654 RepID=UPI001BB1F2D1|nr:uncharacterized protein LOC121421047 [Lytechinus variegatus]